MEQLARLETNGRVARVIIDNPKSRNGLTADSCQALAEMIKAADADPEVRCIVLVGEGQHFCSGADLKKGFKQVAGAGPDVMRERIRDGFHSVVRALQATDTPTLAVIRGACVGFGFDLMLHCDLRICAHQSKFGQVFKRIGLVPDGGSSYMLSRIVGLGRAMELMLLAETFDGPRALELGLVNRAVPEPELDALAEDWANRLSEGPPMAYRHARRNLRLGAQPGTLEDALHREVEAQLECLQSRDMMRGVQAFFLKKTPKFEGN